MRRDVSLLAPVPEPRRVPPARAGAGVIVPVRGFVDAKARLSSRLDAAERAALSRRMAERVVAAADRLPVVVISCAPEVNEWATTLAPPAAVVDAPPGLDAAARAGVAWCAARGLARAVIAHADLPWARSLRPLARDGSCAVVAVVPDHRDDGSPVLSLPVDAPFQFAYGPDSFRRHAREARRLGLAWRVVRDASLAFDVDVPADLVRLGEAASRHGPG